MAQPLQHQGGFVRRLYPPSLALFPVVQPPVGFAPPAANDNEPDPRVNDVQRAYEQRRHAVAAAGGHA